MMQTAALEPYQIELVESIFQSGRAVLTWRTKEGRPVVAGMGALQDIKELELGQRAGMWGSTLETVERDAWAANDLTSLPFYDFLLSARGL